jgi:hypothetical protein
MRKTRDQLDNARVRALFVSAQICDVDFKIDQALTVAFDWVNAWQVKQSEWGTVFASIYSFAPWVTSDPNQSVGQQLCRIVFETFGYSTAHGEAAAAVMLGTFAKAHTNGSHPNTATVSAILAFITEF